MILINSPGTSVICGYRKAHVSLVSAQLLAQVTCSAIDVLKRIENIFDTALLGSARHELHQTFSSGTADRTSITGGLRHNDCSYQTRRDGILLRRSANDAADFR